MLYTLTANSVINPARQMHYCFHHNIDPSVYPQVHDFYELALTTGGCIYTKVDQQTLTLRNGALLLLRPGEVHSRNTVEKGSFINVAFPTSVIEDMFAYLDNRQWLEMLRRPGAPLLAQLSPGETLLLQARLERLNLLPAGNGSAVIPALRLLMIDVVMQYILPTLSAAPVMSYPVWMQDALQALEAPESFSWTLTQLAARYGKTKEYVCRSFQRYLGVTPTAYINAKRLNYAANLLLHSDQKVIDVAYNAGFQSASRFYHAFRREFSVSPLAYRRNTPNS